MHKSLQSHFIFLSWNKIASYQSILNLFEVAVCQIINMLWDPKKGSIKTSQIFSFSQWSLVFRRGWYRPLPPAIYCIFSILPQIGLKSLNYNFYLIWVTFVFNSNLMTDAGTRATFFPFPFVFKNSLERSPLSI